MFKNKMPRKKKVLKGAKSRSRPAWAKSISPAQLAAYRQQYAMSGAGQSGGSSFWSWLKKVHDWVKDHRIISTTGRLAQEVFPDNRWLREGTDFLQNRGYGKRQSGGSIISKTVNHPTVLRTR